ncbi:MAG: hypothetical protein HZB77_10980 [Chloroflexi bacterium]|nr:hypothetical protein [Chloroflexota bacterium]
MTHNRMTILQQLDDGKIDAQEALRLFESEPEPDAPADAVTTTRIPDPSIQKWKRWWRMPFGFGVGVTVIGAALMYSALNAWGVGFGVFFASILFFIGVIIMALAWWSRSARWLHVRVDTGEDKFPQHIAISFPIPTCVVSWAVKFSARKNLNASDKFRTVSEMIAMMDQGVSSDAPLFVEVNEGKERVQVFIG